MPPTARLGDVGGHRNVMASASPNVIVNGRGVHRRTDITVCPIHGIQVTIANVANTVITNGLATAHIASISSCRTGIATGSPNVITE